MKILVTGAAGFIGFHATQRLLRAGHGVVGIDNLNDYYDTKLKKNRLARLAPSKKFDFMKLDIGDKNKIKRLFDRYKFGAVLHLAAQVGVRYSLENPDQYIQSNVAGFLNILEACRMAKIQHLVYASSSSVYGTNKKIPFSTLDRADTPASLYGATKKSNELMAYAYHHLFGLKVTGLRFFTVYGPWGRPDMAYFIFTKNILEGKTIPVFNHGNMRRDFTYIDDIVDGIESALFKAKAHPGFEIYNLGNSQSVGLMQLVKLVEKYTGRQAKIRYRTIQPGDIERTYADISCSKKRLGFEPKVDIEAGVKRFVAWYKDYHNLV